MDLVAFGPIWVVEEDFVERQGSKIEDLSNFAMVVGLADNKKN